ncbi:MAG: hypothetical protein COY19_02795, partial [Candidatus Marinimicrobia bacterium CG_4_10_14_0_2_um_filter_48_9]
MSAFPQNGQVLTEKSSPDAGFPYARSKREGEVLCRKYSEYFPISIVRFAAVFSDWCEYGPLYMFIKSWLSHRWNHRILAGRGDSAVTYIHIHCLVKLLERIL